MLNHSLSELLDCASESIYFGNPNDLRRLNVQQLYVESGLDRRYDRYLSSISALVSRGQFRAAHLMAFDAYEIRCSGRFHLVRREERFAADLIEIGSYALAQEVIETLPPVEHASRARKYSAETRASLAAVRQMLLGKAFLGTRDYQSALKELRKDVPNIVKDKAIRLELDEAILRAYLLAGDKEQVPLYLKKCRSEGASERALSLIKDIHELRKHDDTGAQRIAVESWAYFSKCRRLGHCETIPMLDFVAMVLHLRGHQASAMWLQHEVDKLKYSNWS